MEEKKQITNKEAGAPEEEAGESMSFWDHLEVLRWAIFRIACFLCVCMHTCAVAGTVLLFSE